MANTESVWTHVHSSLGYIVIIVYFIVNVITLYLIDKVCRGKGVHMLQELVLFIVLGRNLE